MNVARRIAATVSSGASGASRPTGGEALKLFATVQHDFALSTQVVFFAMAGVMAASGIVARFGMERGIPAEVTAGSLPTPVGIHAEGRVALSD